MRKYTKPIITALKIATGIYALMIAFLVTTLIIWAIFLGISLDDNSVIWWFVTNIILSGLHSQNKKFSTIIDDCTDRQIQKIKQLAIAKDFGGLNLHEHLQERITIQIINTCRCF